MPIVVASVQFDPGNLGAVNDVRAALVLRRAFAAAARAVVDAVFLASAVAPGAPPRRVVRFEADADANAAGRDEAASLDSVVAAAVPALNLSAAGLSGGGGGAALPAGSGGDARRAAATAAEASAAAPTPPRARRLAFSASTLALAAVNVTASERGNSSAVFITLNILAPSDGAAGAMATALAATDGAALRDALSANLSVILAAMGVNASTISFPMPPRAASARFVSKTWQFAWTRYAAAAAAVIAVAAALIAFVVCISGARARALARPAAERRRVSFCAGLLRELLLRDEDVEVALPPERNAAAEALLYKRAAARAAAPVLTSVRSFFPPELRQRAARAPPPAADPDDPRADAASDDGSDYGAFADAGGARGTGMSPGGGGGGGGYARGGMEYDAGGEGMRGGGGYTRGGMDYDASGEGMRGGGGGGYPRGAEDFYEGGEDARGGGGYARGAADSDEGGEGTYDRGGDLARGGGGGSLRGDTRARRHSFSAAEDLARGAAGSPDATRLAVGASEPAPLAAPAAPPRMAPAELPAPPAAARFQTRATSAAVTFADMADAGGAEELADAATDAVAAEAATHAARAVQLNAASARAAAARHVARTSSRKLK